MESVYETKLPEPLRFFLENNIHPKSDEEILTFMSSKKIYSRLISCVIDYFLEYQKIDAYLNLIDSLDSDDFLSESIEPAIFHLLNDKQRAKLISILERLTQNKHVFGIYYLEETLARLRLGPIPVPEIRFVPRPNLIKEFKPLLLEKNHEAALGLLLRYKIRPYECLEILNMAIEHDFLAVAAEIIKIIPEAELLIFFNQIAYGLSILPEPDAHQALEFYGELKKQIPSLEKELEELSDRFLSFTNLEKILAVDILTPGLGAIFLATKIPPDFGEYIPVTASEDSSMTKTYGTGISQTLFKWVQTNISKAAALKLPDDPMAFNFQAFMDNIYHCRVAIAYKANPMHSDLWEIRTVQAIYTPISERYMPYYRKILDVLTHPENREYLVIKGTSLEICYRKDGHNIPLTTYPIEKKWQHTNPIYLPQIKSILEQGYQDILGKRPLPKTEAEFRENFLPEIASCHWLLSQICPYRRGSAFVAEVVTKAFCYYFGFDCSFDGWMPDCEAMVTPNPREFQGIFADKVHLGATLAHLTSRSPSSPSPSMAVV